MTPVWFVSLKPVPLPTTTISYLIVVQTDVNKNCQSGYYFSPLFLLGHGDSDDAHQMKKMKCFHRWHLSSHGTANLIIR